MKRDDIVLALFADPVAHSLSPLIHHMGLAENKLEGRYLKVEADTASLKEAFHAMVMEYGDQFRGANFSFPNKVAALELVDRYDESVKWIGAMNTIVREQDEWVGYNTDGIGFIRSLEKEGQNVEGQTWLVIGTGGAARSLIIQGALSGVKGMHIFATKQEYVTSMRQTLAPIEEQTGCHFTLDVIEHHAMTQAITDCDVAINATSMGLKDNKSPVSDDFCFPNKVKLVVDINYQPLVPRFLQQAKAQNKRVMNGLAMLIHQGIAAFELWTGHTISDEAVTRLFDDALIVHHKN